MRAGAAVLCLVLAAASPNPADFVDAVLGEAEGRVVTASDAALARALGLFGSTPTAEPIRAADVDRLLDAWLVAGEARRLGIGGEPDEVEAAWGRVAARLGGPGALEAWLARVGVEPERTRALVAEDARVRRFVQIRFRDFAFVTPADLEIALGPGPHREDIAAEARERLREAETQRRLRAWVEERARRAPRRRLLDEGAEVPNPFPMP